MDNPVRVGIVGTGWGIKVSSGRPAVIVSALDQDKVLSQHRTGAASPQRIHSLMVFILSV